MISMSCKTLHATEQKELFSALQLVRAGEADGATLLTTETDDLASKPVGWREGGKQPAGDLQGENNLEIDNDTFENEAEDGWP